MTLGTAAAGVVSPGMGTYNIGFNSDDETQFDAYDIAELLDLWIDFCVENGLGPTALIMWKGCAIVEKIKKMGLNEVLNVSFSVVVTPDDIDDIMVSALEGGINYWCSKAEVVGEYLGEYGSEQISRGGILKLYNLEENKVYELTKEKFLKGLEKYIKNPIYSDFLEFKDHEIRLDTGYADADVADTIIQYALFDDVIFG